MEMLNVVDEATGKVIGVESKKVVYEKHLCCEIITCWLMSDTGK